MQNKNNLTNEQIDALEDIGFTEVRAESLEGTSELYIIKMRQMRQTNIL